MWRAGFEGSGAFLASECLGRIGFRVQWLGLEG